MPNYADTSNYTDEECRFWNWLVANQSRPFETLRGLSFCIVIRGNELFIDRKKKGLTRSTVNVALKKAQEIKEIRKTPKELGTFGASYLMPLLVAYGALENKTDVVSKAAQNMDTDDLFPGF